METQRRKLLKRPKDTSSPASPATSRISTASSSRSADTTNSLNATNSLARLSLTQHSASHLIGPAFDAEAIINTISYGAPIPPQPSNSPPRTPQSVRPTAPSTLQHTRTYDDTWKKMDRISPPRADTGGAKSPRQRYSDEVRPENPRKKSMFSNILNGVKGTPRRPTISTPTNPTHVTHVSIDNATGQYMVCTELIAR
jgi:p21-activated kinase 1